MLAVLSAAATALLDVRFVAPATRRPPQRCGDAVRRDAGRRGVLGDAMVGIPAAPVDLSTLSDWNMPKRHYLWWRADPSRWAGSRFRRAHDRLVCALAQEDDTDARLRAVVTRAYAAGSATSRRARASDTVDAPPEFEDLVACASYYGRMRASGSVLSKKSRLIWQWPVVTHRARLPAVVLAYKTLGENDARREKLRELPAPTDTRATAPPPPPAKDPWLRTDGKGLGML